MIKKHLLPIALAAVASPLLATYTEDTLDIFKPDTVVTAGDYTLSCETYKEEQGSQVPWIFSKTLELTDSLGRQIEKTYIKSTSKQGSGSGSESHLYLDSAGQVKVHISSEYEKDNGYGTVTHDTLWGTTWNSYGMILTGELIHHYSAGSGGEGVESVDTTTIHLTYDADSVTAIDTVEEGVWFEADTVIYAGMYQLSVKFDTLDTDTLAPWANKQYYSYTDSIGRVVVYLNASGTYNGPGSGGGIKTELLLDTAGNTVCKSIVKYAYNPALSDKDTIHIYGKEWNDKGMITFGAQVAHRVRIGTPEPYDTTDTTFFYISYEDDDVTIKDTLQAPYGYYTDTLYPAGDITVPCIYENYLPPIYRGPGISKTDVAYRDSLGRVIYKLDAYADAIGRYSRSSLLSSEFDSLSRMKKEYHSNYSGGQGGFGESKTTLLGTKWNGKGMITTGLLFKYRSNSKFGSSYDTTWISLSYDSTDLTPTDTLYLDSLVADTIILAHHTPVPAWKTSIDNSSETDTGTIYEYRDELGRLVYHQELTIDTTIDVWEMCTTSVTMDSANTMTAMRTSYQAASGNGYSTVVSTLIGDDWNNKGMITTGELTTRKFLSGLKGGSHSGSIQRIELVYDSTDVTVIDTLFLDDVNVVEQSAIQQKGISIRKLGAEITLTGLQGGTSVNLYMANGRLLQSVTSSTKGAARLNLTTFPSGIYFIHTKERTFKITNK